MEYIDTLAKIYNLPAGKTVEINTKKRKIGTKKSVCLHSNSFFCKLIVFNRHRQTSCRQKK